MVTRAFPVIYASDVSRSARFWERLGFTRFVELPPGDDPGYVGLRRGDFEIAVTAADWPRRQYGLEPGQAPRFEMYVYVDDVDRVTAQLRDEGVTVLKDPADMWWGERIATVTDPDGNPVALSGEPGS